MILVCCLSEVCLCGYGIGFYCYGLVLGIALGVGLPCVRCLDVTYCDVCFLVGLILLLCVCCVTGFGGFA